MAEGNDSPSQNRFSYFCFPCRHQIEDTERVFNFIFSLGHTCAQCGKKFNSGFMTEKKMPCEVGRSEIQRDFCILLMRIPTIGRSARKVLL
ncbi:hypothetical protein TNCT_437171 [Trichonephila clavata]|uniref:Uncharacterized protein n=1 Tax=Trichonephila clavata TaxID=2740835 RepID=A0A8X6GWD8_TRICU|nr:hypothetical protein TNCT_437171 [Trichonephila clavata]